MAEEVRSLVKGTSDSTDEINDMITELKTIGNEAIWLVPAGLSLTSTGVQSTGATNSLLSIILDQITEISGLVLQISGSKEEQLS